MEYLVLAFALLSFLVHLGLAVAVFADARRRDVSRLPLAIGPGLWAWSTLLGSVVTVGIYWVIYHSTLNPDRGEN